MVKISDQCELWNGKYLTDLEISKNTADKLISAKNLN